MTRQTALKLLAVCALALTACGKKTNCIVTPPAPEAVFKSIGGPGNPSRIWSVCYMLGSVETCVNRALLWEEAQALLKEKQGRPSRLEFYITIGYLEQPKGKP